MAKRLIKLLRSLSEEIEIDTKKLSSSLDINYKKIVRDGQN